MSELYGDGSGDWSSSQPQMKVPEVNTQLSRRDEAVGQKTGMTDAAKHGAGQGDQDHGLQSPKSADDKVPSSPPKKQNPFV